MNYPVASLLDFRGKVALVTGGGSGLGQGIARRFAEAGASLVVHYHSSAAGAQAVVQEVVAAGGQAIAIAADLTQSDEVARVIGQACEAYGRLDVLINNAGAFPMAGALEMTEAQWDEVLNANLRTVFLCSQAAARQMIAQGSGGSIVNITSIEAERPNPKHSHYAAAKAGVTAYTRATAWELAPHGIRVNAVAPGLIWRPGLEESWPEGVARWLEASPMNKIGHPEEVADACLFLASDAARWITGASLPVDGGATARPAF